MALGAVHLAALLGLVVLLGFGPSASGAFGCAPSVACIDSGQLAVIDRLWARQPYLQWFSGRAPGARLGPAAYNRSTLASYFGARMRAHENLRVIRLGAGYDPKRNIVNFAGKLVRSADDLPAGARRTSRGQRSAGWLGPS